MTMPPLTASFVLHFGEMGSRWGFNRTIGQVFALLVMSEEALTANDLSDSLGISRGNVSMAVKELQSWQLAKVMHRQGDRKEYYYPAGDIMALAIKVFEQRRKREVDPTLSVVRDILMEQPATPQDEYAQAKVREVHDLLESLSKWADDLQQLNPDSLQTLMKLGTRMGKVLEFKERLFSDAAAIEPESPKT